MSDNLTENLLRKKKQIEESKSKKDRIKGGLEQDFSQLDKLFKIATVKEGKAEKEKLEKELDKINSDLDKKVQQLEDSYEWN
jgi:uncharacterized protein YicC (UPF0701 family)